MMVPDKCWDCLLPEADCICEDSDYFGSCEEQKEEEERDYHMILRKRVVRSLTHAKKEEET